MDARTDSAFVCLIRRRPLLPLAALFTLGILAEHCFAVPVWPLLLGASLCTFAALPRWRAATWFLSAAIIFAGAGRHALRTSVIAPDDLRNVVGVEPCEAIVRGTLVESPYQRVYNRDGTEHWRTLARIRLEAIALNHQWTSAFGDVIVSTTDIIDEHFFLGQHVEIEGVIRPPREPLAAGLFDYRGYLSTLGIHYQLIVSSTNDWRLLNAPIALRSPASTRFIPWARQMLARGLPHDRHVELLWAMTLGWKTALSGEVSEPFMRSGTMHVFAISGLHIALIAAILVAALKLFRLRRATCAWIVIPLIWFYTGMTGWQGSAVRSTIMSSVIIAGWCLRRPSDLINSLMLAGVIILAWDPLQLFQAGFQLSFFVVLALALLTPVLDKLRKRMLALDEFLAPEFRTRLWRWTNAGAHAFLASFAVSLVAWLGSLPLIAHYFHLLTPVTLLANMIVVPLSSGALACNLATLTIGACWPPVAELFNNCAWLLMVLMVKMSEWSASIPLMVLHVKSPSISTLIVYYLALIMVFSGWLVRAQVRKWTPALAVIAAIPFVGHVKQIKPSELTVLPLNGGSAVYIEHDRNNLLLDCGAIDAARWITKPFLQARGINRLPHLVLTHGDILHVEAAPLIHETFGHPNVYTSPVRFLSRPYRNVQAYFRTNGITTKSLTAGDRIGSWQVLHPAPEDKFPQADDNAIVLFGTIYGQRILLLSDLGTQGQNTLLERHPDLRADIIITGLPRESAPVADGFLDMVQPKTIVIADAEYEPAPDRLRTRLAKRHVRVLYTSELGSVTFSFDRHGRAQIVGKLAIP